MTGSNNKKTELSDWLAYHKILIDDIQYAKTQQWRLAYFTVLLLAAIFGLSKTILIKPEYVNILLIIAFLLSIASTYFLYTFQKDLKRYRQNIGKVRENFPDDLQQLAKFKKAEGSPTYYVSFLFFLIGVIWVSVFLIGWSIKVETNTSRAENLDVDTNWHRYEGRTFEVIGDYRQFVEVLSDGWKIIGKLSNEDEYEWGWEVVIKALKNSDAKTIIFKDGTKMKLLCSFEKIEYTLFDKDGFELVKDILNSRSLDWGSTEKFRSTYTISKNKAIRATKSSFRIITFSNP